MQKIKILIVLLVLPLSKVYSKSYLKDYRPINLDSDSSFVDKKPTLDKPLEHHLAKFLPFRLDGDNKITQFPKPESGERIFNVDRDNLTLWTTAMSLAIPTGVLVQGVLSWDWGKDKKKFGVGKEGWFGIGSYSGGADKTGHMMSHFIQKRFYTWLFYNLGHDLKQAQLYGLMGAGLTGLMIELGDGISRFRFSWEDILMDTIGITLGWFLDQYPKLDELIGLRWEYWPSEHWFHEKNSDKVDFMSDYNGQKFFFSVKAKGIPVLSEKWYTKYLTLDVGFYTRGYKPDFSPDNIKNNNNSQWMSYGVGINLGSLINDVSPKNLFTKILGGITKYWVPPGIIYHASGNITRGKYSSN